MNIVIRPAIPSDAPHVAEVLMRAWEVAYPDIMPTEYIQERNGLRPEQYMQRLADDDNTYYVFCDGERIVGYMRIVDAPKDDTVDSSAFDLEQIYLHPEYWHQGIGTQALAFAFDLTRDAGKSEMTVWVLAQNTSAIAFYKKAGSLPTAQSATGTMAKCLRAFECGRCYNPCHRAQLVSK